MTRNGKVCLAAAVALALTACTTPENAYFTLNTTGGSPDSAARGAGRSLSIDDVAIPAYLDRPQIVVRTDQNRVEVREYERWMEPLDDMIRRVLLADLSRVSGADSVSVSAANAADSLSVTITAFGEEAHRAVLRGAWSIKPRDKDAKRGAEHRFYFDAPVEGQDTASAVAALSTLIGRLSEDIASNR
jgi:uncharacterized lipoprotein YmbA